MPRYLDPLQRCTFEKCLWLKRNIISKSFLKVYEVAMLLGGDSYFLLFSNENSTNGFCVPNVFLSSNISNLNPKQ